MSCKPSRILTLTVCLAIFATGCSPSKPAYFRDTGDLSYFVDQATKVEYPDVEYPSLDEVTQSLAPITVTDPDFTSFDDMTLEDAISYALSNTKVIRGYGTPSLQQARVAPGQDNLSNSPRAAGTTYNVAIRESEPGFIGTPGQIADPGNITTNTGLDTNQGVEAALSDFDAQLTGSLNYGKSDEPRNNDDNALNRRVFQQDQVTWQSEIAKKSANGTQIFFRNINQYTANNIPLQSDVPPGLQTLDSWYRASFEAEIRQPLMRGRGTFINRMPIVVSRIGTDQEIANLESTLQNMVTNVEIRYWDLYCAYRSFEAAKKGRNAALNTWRIVKDQFDLGADVNIQQVAQAEEQVYDFQAQIYRTKNDLLNAEGQLRYLLGWASTDGNFIRPIDEPVMAPIEFDWFTSLCEALSYRPELRQERWEIKKRELALQYAKNGLLPVLNVSLLYRWLGLGNKYGTSDPSEDFPGVDSGALNELYGGNFQELTFGGTFAMPVGFRREQANVRNAQLKLAREIAFAEDMELDIEKELTEAIRALSTNRMIMISAFNQWRMTTIEEEHFDRLEDEGAAELDIALRAQQRAARSEVEFYTALCEYNKVIALIHRRKGTILPYCGVNFSEGPWPGKAYMDAREHARRRGASRQINYGWSRPQVISRGEDWPTADNIGHLPGAFTKSADNESDLEMLPPPLNNGPMNSAPYYEFPRGEELPTPNLTPTPAIQGSTTQNVVSPAVQAVNYTEPIVAASQATSMGESSRKTNNVAAPVAILKQPKNNSSQATILQASKPLRDNSAQPAKRLKAATPLPTTSTGETAQPKRAGASTAVLRSGNLPWEKLGLSRPESNAAGTTAKIKTK